MLTKKRKSKNDILNPNEPNEKFDISNDQN